MTAKDQERPPQGGPAGKRRPQRGAKGADLRQIAHRMLMERGNLEEERRAGPHEARARDLVSGIRRRRWTLDAVLRRFATRAPKDIDAPILAALRIGIHGLLFRRHVPAPKIVSEAVALAGASKGARAFANAVLRKVAGGFTVEPEPPVEEVGRFPPRDRNVILLGGGERARFEKPVLPDPREDLIGYDAVQHSLPRPFVEGLVGFLPEAHEAFFRACSQPLAPALQPLGSFTHEELAAELVAAGQPAEVVEAAGARAVALTERGADAPSLSELPPLRDGRALVQDLTPASAVKALAPQPGERILDLCAAPGGKTLAIGHAMGTGRLVAAHVRRRLPELQAALAKLPAGLEASLHDLGPEGTELPPETELFDAVLVDAPCSNSGVLMKRVEARERLDQDHFERLEALQDRLLLAAASRCAPGGRILYTTCSIVPGENQAAVRRFLTSSPAFELDEEVLHWPHETTRDGGYFARLRHKA